MYTVVLSEAGQKKVQLTALASDGSHVSPSKVNETISDRGKAAGVLAFDLAALCFSRASIVGKRLKLNAVGIPTEISFRQALHRKAENAPHPPQQPLVKGYKR